MKILQIEAHPDFSNKSRTANVLADVGYDALINLDIKEEDIDRVQLYNPELPSLRITDKTLSGQEDETLTAYRNQILEQFIEADQVYIYMPLYNFNIVSMLKDYFDTILIANKTFKYTENGSVGLLSDDKQVTFVMTSGSEYGTEYRYKNLDFAPQLVSATLHMMGIEKLKVIRAEGLDIISNDKEAIIDDAKHDLVDWIYSIN